MPKTTYKNPWHKKYPADGWRKSLGPEFYESDSEPVEHRGVLIYRRQEFGYPIFDVVKDGTCVNQLAGPTGAKRAIDELLATEIKEVTPCPT